eukprot:jgi/Botrbrau1/19180/Bobra.0077s0088.2
MEMAHLVLPFVLSLLLSPRTSSGIRPIEYVENVDGFPGWKGELPIVPTQENNHKEFPVNRDGVWTGSVEVVSWSPRAFLYKNFLTEEECDYIIDHARARMSKSTVVDNDTGKSVDSEIRTSTGMFYNRNENEVITRIEKRIAVATNLPQENGEAIQVLHYQDGQKYEPHNDYFFDSYNQRPENGGQRIATVLMYLSTPEEGGETVFPTAETKVSGEGWSDCARAGLAVKARKGDALLFYGMTPDGDLDPHSLHGSCPTLKGEKWSATKWIHVGEFGGMWRPKSVSPPRYKKR